MKDTKDSGPAETVKGVGAAAGQHDLSHESQARRDTAAAQRNTAQQQAEASNRQLIARRVHREPSSSGATLSGERPVPGAARAGALRTLPTPGRVGMILPANGLPPGQIPVPEMSLDVRLVADEDDFETVRPTLKSFAGRLRPASLSGDLPVPPTSRIDARRPRDTPDRPPSAQRRRAGCCARTRSA